jgi:hypothetical protein
MIRPTRTAAEQWASSLFPIFLLISCIMVHESSSVKSSVRNQAIHLSISINHQLFIDETINRNQLDEIGMPGTKSAEEQNIIFNSPRFKATNLHLSSCVLSTSIRY